MKKILLISLMFNFLTVMARGQESELNFSPSLSALNLPQSMTIGLQQDAQHVLNVDADPTWRKMLSEREKNEYVFEKNTKDQGAKSLLQFNLNSDGTVKNAISFYMDQENPPEKEVRYSVFSTPKKIQSTTICWNFKACVTLNPTYCRSVLRTQKDGKLNAFLNENVVGRPKGHFNDESLGGVRKQQADNQKAMLHSYLKEQVPGFFNGFKTPIAYLSPDEKSQAKMDEIVSTCKDIIKANTEEISKVQPIHKRPRKVQTAP